MIPGVWFPSSLTENLKRHSILVDEPYLKQYVSPEAAMRLAIQEAYKGLGFVSPNPLVGCVVLDSKNQFLSKGFHAQVGGAHAEIHAAQNLSDDDLKEATIYVTLEPCAHQGRTPSCAKWLATKPIKKVVYGLMDPNPLVAGKGLEILKSAGIEVEEFLGLGREIEMVSEHFCWNMKTQKVWVSLKVASSLDGMLAHQSGESQWITDEVSREVSHVLRAAHDAIMVGSGTVLQDNPMLNIRSLKLTHKKPWIFVMDPRGDALQKAHQLRMTSAHEKGRIVFIISSKFSNLVEKDSFNVLQFKTSTEGQEEVFDLDEVLTSLWQKGVRSLFVEGGAVTISSFIQQKKAQRLYLFQAPILLGAKSGKPWSSQVSIGSMKEKKILSDLQTLQLNSDLLMTGKF